MVRAVSALTLVVVLALGAIMVGLLAAGWMRGWAGGPSPSIGLAASPVRAALACLALLFLLGGVAAGVARAGFRHTSWVLAGVGLMAWASRTGTATAFEQVGGSRTALAVEGLAWCVLLFGWAAAVYRLERGGRGAHPAARSTAISQIAAGVVALGVSAMSIWLFARTGLKGQALAATTIGGLFGVTAAVAAGGHPRLSMSWIVALGATAHVLAAALPELRDALWFGAWLQPMPGDYAAGALLGGSLGLAWAGTLVVSDQVESKRATPAMETAAPRRQTGNSHAGGASNGG